MEAFSDKAVRRGFIKKVYGILTVQVCRQKYKSQKFQQKHFQLAVTAGVLLFFMFGIVPMECEESYDYDYESDSTTDSMLEYDPYEKWQ